MNLKLFFIFFAIAFKYSTAQYDADEDFWGDRVYWNSNEFDERLRFSQPESKVVEGDYHRGIGTVPSADWKKFKNVVPLKSVYEDESEQDKYNKPNLLKVGEKLAPAKPGELRHEFVVDDIYEQHHKKIKVPQHVEAGFSEYQNDDMQVKYPQVFDTFTMEHHVQVGPEMTEEAIEYHKIEASDGEEQEKSYTIDIEPTYNLKTDTGFSNDDDKSFYNFKPYEVYEETEDFDHEGRPLQMQPRDEIKEEVNGPCEEVRPQEDINLNPNNTHVQSQPQQESSSKVEQQDVNAQDSSQNEKQQKNEASNSTEEKVPQQDESTIIPAKDKY